MVKKTNNAPWLRFDIAIVIGVVIICLIVILMTKRPVNNEVIVQILYNNQIVQEINLTNSADMQFTLSENEGVRLEIFNHQIRFQEVDCPDKLCENYGYLKHANEIAICLPNRVSLKLIGKTNDFDILVN